MARPEDKEHILFGADLGLMKKAGPVNPEVLENVGGFSPDMERTLDAFPDLMEVAEKVNQGMPLTSQEAVIAAAAGLRYR
jgi:hypothetical protein